MIGRLTGTLAAKSPPQVLVDVRRRRLRGRRADVELLQPAGARRAGHAADPFRRPRGRADPVRLPHPRRSARPSACSSRSPASARAPRCRSSPACRSTSWRRRSRCRRAAASIKVPGIGKKTAERLLLELKGKLGDAVAAPASVDVERAGRHPAGAGRARLQRPRGERDAEDAAGRRRGGRRHQAGAARAREVTGAARVERSAGPGVARATARPAVVWRAAPTIALTSTLPARSNSSVIGKLASVLERRREADQHQVHGRVPGFICTFASARGRCRRPRACA